MAQHLTIYINEESFYEYEDTAGLDESKIQFIEKMDSDMSQGIKIAGELIKQPNPEQCANFVAMNLIRALSQENDAAVNVSCAYLAHKNSMLIELRASNENGSLEIEFIEESYMVNQ